MAQAIGHKDLGTGEVVEIYDDGSTKTWNITTGAITGQTPAIPGVNLSQSRSSLGDAQRTLDYLEQVYGSDWYRKYVSDPMEREAQNQQQQRDRAYQFQQDQLGQRAREIELTQGRDAASQWYQEQQVGLARERLALDRENAKADQAIRQAGLGLQGLSLLGSLRGPESYAQASNVAHGLSADPFTTGAIQALRNGTSTGPLFRAPSGVAAPVTMDSLANMAVNGTAGITPAASGATTNAAGLRSVPTVAGMSSNQDDVAAYDMLAAGPQSLAVGSLESLDPMTAKMLGSRLENVGGYLPNFVSGYNAARPWQRSALAA